MKGKLTMQKNKDNEIEIPTLTTLDQVKELYENKFVGKCSYEHKNFYAEINSFEEGVSHFNSVEKSIADKEFAEKSKNVNISDMRQFEKGPYNKDVTEFAYPFERQGGMIQHGMTKRERYAMMALQCIYTNESQTILSSVIKEEIQDGVIFDEAEKLLQAVDKSFDIVVEKAFRLADKMVKLSDIDFFETIDPPAETFWGELLNNK